MDRYQRVKVLGRGSYGQAVLVRDRQEPKQPPRVVKEIDTSRLPPAAQREAQTEVGVLRSLSHPNIVAYYETFFEGTKLCIVMEFADGGDLSEAVKARLPQHQHYKEDEALGIFVQCCRALQHVHSKKVLHRDIKSQNIFLTKAQVVKLGDFGIAKVLDHTAAEAMTMIGTPIYLAPEVCDSKPYGTKADIWSMGIVLYELFALKPPFQATNIASLVVKIMRKDPEPVSAVLYSESARGLLDSMLRKSPDQRPAVEHVLSHPAVRASCRSGPEGMPDALDGLLQQGCSSGQQREELPPASVRQRSAERGGSEHQSALAAEFHRNRELAARLKARQEGGPCHRPPSVPRSRSVEPSSGGSVAAPRAQPSTPARASEDQHLQALQEAAAQAYRDRKQVQQRMRDLDAGINGIARDDPTAFVCDFAPNDRRPSSLDRNSPRTPVREPEDDATQLFRGPPVVANAAAGRQAAEERHLQALQQASAEARRERRLLQQRMRDADRGGFHEENSIDESDDCSKAGPSHEPRHRKPDEAEHLQALQEAAAQAYRERKALQQKMRDLENRAQPAPELHRDHGDDRGGHRVDTACSKAEAREAAEAQHRQALQEAAAEARRERKMLQQRMQSQEREGESSFEGLRDSRPPIQQDARPRSGGSEAQKSHRRSSGRSSLSFAGGLVTGSRSGSRAGSNDSSCNAASLVDGMFDVEAPRTQRGSSPQLTNQNAVLSHTLADLNKVQRLTFTADEVAEPCTVTEEAHNKSPQGPKVNLAATGRLPRLGSSGLGLTKSHEDPLASTGENGDSGFPDSLKRTGKGMLSMTGRFGPGSLSGSLCPKSAEQRAPIGAADATKAASPSSSRWPGAAQPAALASAGEYTDGSLSYTATGTLSGLSLITTS